MLENKINVAINRDLRKKYGIRQFPIVKGDIVKIISGSRKGEGGKVIDVSHKSKKISIEGVTIAKADGKQVEYYIDHSNLVITKLDLSSPGRYNKIKDITARRSLPPPEPEAPEPEENENIENNEELTEETTEETEQEIIDDRAGSEESDDGETDSDDSEGNDNEESSEDNVKEDGDNDEN